MTLKRFFAYSIAVHTLILVAVMFFMPIAKEKKMGGEFFARLVSPDEFLDKVPFIHAIPEVGPVPPARPEAITPAPLIQGDLPDVTEPGPSISQPMLPPMYQSPRTEEGSVIEGIMQKPDKLGPSTKEKLFDRSIISDLAKREIEKNWKEKNERTFTFNIKELQYIGYMKRLKEKIESIWIYPSDAAAKGIYGDLIIKFTIKKNGRLGIVELIRTSGHKSLDDAAMKALRDGDPYWPLPDEWKMEAYTIEGHFLYTIYGYYIR